MKAKIGWTHYAPDTKHHCKECGKPLLQKYRTKKFTGFCQTCWGRWLGKHTKQWRK